MTEFAINNLFKRRSLTESGKAVVILGSLVIAAILGITTYEIWRQRQNTLSGAERGLESLSLALSEQTERAFHSAELVLEATVGSLSAAGGMQAAGTTATHEILKERITGVPVIFGLAVIDAHGTVINSARPIPPGREFVPDHEYFSAHATNPSTRIRIGVPVASPVDGRVLIPVTRRVSGPDGSFQGIVLAAVNPAYFEAFYGRVLPDEGGAFALFRSDAVLLARHPATDQAVGKRFATLPMFRPGMPGKGVSWGPSPLDGMPRIVSYNRLDTYPLAISVSLDQGTLLAPWRGNSVRLALAALLATTILVLAIVALLKQLERERAQSAALRQSEERLQFAQFALDHAADMVFWFNIGGRILYANQVACDALGYSPDEITTLLVSDLDASMAGAGWARLVEDLRRDPRRRFETMHSTRDGTAFPTEVSVNYVEFGGTALVCAFVRDITLRKRAEVALAEKTASLEASNAELEQFAYVASHDLREPLRMVNSFVTMLERRYSDKLDADGREYIAFAQDGAVRMDRLILDLLEYSRVGRLDRPLAPLPLGKIVELAVKGLGLAAQEAGATIEIAPDLPTIMGNEEELVRLYLNLVGNALKYRHPDRPAKVVLGAEVRGNEVVCSVRDNGIGIAPAYYERIFRIFQRLHARDKYEGTGIGLAICKKIVERHGGRIWVESVPDQGSTFRFTLRCA